MLPCADDNIPLKLLNYWKFSIQMSCAQTAKSLELPDLDIVLFAMFALKDTITIAHGSTTVLVLETTECTFHSYVSYGFYVWLSCASLWTASVVDPLRTLVTAPSDLFALLVFVTFQLCKEHLAHLTWFYQLFSSSPAASFCMSIAKTSSLAKLRMRDSQWNQPRHLVNKRTLLMLMTMMKTLKHFLMNQRLKKLLLTMKAKT